MLSFVNIEQELSYQTKENSCDLTFACPISRPDYLIDFSYLADAPCTSFYAIKTDCFGKEFDIIILENSLITYSLGKHICTGLELLSESLSAGYYYLIVNNKYQSESFKVISDLSELGFIQNQDIYISGLRFFDNSLDKNCQNKDGFSDINFALPGYSNTELPIFRYKSTESISSSILRRIDQYENILEEINISILSDGNYHFTTSSVDINKPGIYSIIVNNKYESEYFRIYQTTGIFIKNLIIIGELSAGETVNINFDAKLTGENTNIEVEFIIDFDCGIESIVENIEISGNYENYSISLPIPEDVCGICKLRLYNDIECKYYEYEFRVECNCLELVEGGVLDLINGECLELIDVS